MVTDDTFSVQVQYVNHKSSQATKLNTFIAKINANAYFNIASFLKFSNIHTYAREKQKEPKWRVAEKRI